jgi:hypothetical protein
MTKPRREQLANAPINANFAEGLVFNEQNAGFGATHVAAGKGIIWIDNTTTPNRLVFTDESGADHDITNEVGLSGTLAIGNATGANNIQINNGQAIIGDPGSSGPGGNISITCQNGDTNEDGGSITLIAGGATTVPAAYGANIGIIGALASGTVYPEVGIPSGGSILFEGGDNANGSLGSTASFSGAGNTGGGPIVINAGDGTNSGGLINIISGSTIGPEEGASDPSAGDITITAGSITYMDSRTSSGGSIFLNAGDNISTAGYGGSVGINSGDGDFVGNINLQTGTGESEGSILIQTGSSYYDGNISIITGASFTGGGNIQIQTGNCNDNGSNITILCGVTDSGTGSSITIAAGNATDFNGGEILITGGHANGTTGNGGNITITAGESFATDGYGGNVIIIGGEGSGINDGGNVVLTAGAPKGTGVGGSIKLQDYFSNIQFEVSDIGIGFYATPPKPKPNVTGSRGGNAALASLLTELANLGLITDGTS